jgi:hypothetical protein
MLTPTVIIVKSLIDFWPTSRPLLTKIISRAHRDQVGFGGLRSGTRRRIRISELCNVHAT